MTAKKPFFPKDTFDLRNPKSGEAFRSARPIAFVENARFLGYTGPSGSLRALSNRDHLVLELLLTTIGQSDPLDRRPLHSVPVSVILAMLPKGTFERDLRASLDRLTRTVMTLDRVELGLSALDLEPVRPDCDRPISPQDSPSLLPTRPGRNAPPQYRFSRQVLKYLSTPIFQALIEMEPVGVLAPSDFGSLATTVTLTPLRRWTIVEGKLVFDLDRYVRAYIRRDRLQRKSPTSEPRRVPWIHLDLRRMRDLKGGPTVCLYRYLTSKIGWGKLPRKLQIEMTWQQIVDLTAMKVQATGSLRGRVENAVLKAADRDFRQSEGDFHIDIRWRDENGALLDRVRFEIQTELPDLKRLKSKRVTDDGRQSLTSDDRLFISRPDIPSLRVSLGAWSKVNAMYGLDIPGLVRLSTAFDLAIDEMLWMEEGGLVPLTAPYEERRYRGDRLREIIRMHGVDRAAVLFSIEETTDPDLTGEETRLRLRLSRMETHARENRQRRLEASRRGTKWNRVELRPQPEGYVESEIASFRAAKAIEAEKAEILRTDRKAVRIIQDQEKRDLKNAKRRQKRADEKEAARIVEMRIEAERQETARILAVEAQIERENDDRFRQEYDREIESEFLEMIDD